MSFKQQSINRILATLRKEVRAIEGRAQVGLMKAGFFVEAEATKLAPVDTGNLRGSGNTRAILTGGARVAFDAEYAVWVHEIDKNYRVGQWKFLQTVLDERRPEILDIIRRDAKIV